MELGKEIFEAGSQMAIKQGASASTRFQVNFLTTQRFSLMKRDHIKKKGDLQEQKPSF
jgi:hypothetical protein